MPFVDAMKSEGWDDVSRTLSEADLFQTILSIRSNKRAIAADPLLLTYLRRDCALLNKTVAEIESLVP